MNFCTSLKDDLDIDVIGLSLEPIGGWLSQPPGITHYSKSFTQGTLWVRMPPLLIQSQIWY